VGLIESVSNLETWPCQELRCLFHGLSFPFLLVLSEAGSWGKGWVCSFLDVVEATKLALVQFSWLSTLVKPITFSVLLLIFGATIFLSLWSF